MNKLATRRLLLVCIPLFWSSIYIYNGYLSVYAEEHVSSLSIVGIIVAAYGLTQLILRIPVGIASDRMRRRKPFVIAGALFGALSCAAFLIAPTGPVMMLGRGLAGMAAACWVPLSVMLVSTYPSNEITKATSLATALSAIGMTLSSMLGGYLADAVGIRVPFIVGIGLGLATALIILVRVKEPAVADKDPVSFKALFSVGAVPMVLAMSIFALLNQYLSWSMTHAFVPVFANETGIATTESMLGILMSTWQGTYAFTSFFGGAIADRLGVRWTVALGLGCSTAATLLTPLAGTFGIMVALRALHGVGVGIASPVMMAGAVGAVPDEKRGAAMGFFQSIYAIGMVAGPAVSGLFANNLGLSTTFIITGLIGVAAVISVIWFTPRPKTA